MLTPEATYPYPGSYALCHDPDRPQPSPAELVRIMWRRVDEPKRKVGKGGRSEEHGFVAVSFPLRDGAGGNKVVASADLIDGTPLSGEEQREFHDLDRDLRGRFDGAVGLDGRRPRTLTRRQKARAARRDALKSRTIWSKVLADRLRDMRRHVEQRKAA